MAGAGGQIRGVFIGIDRYQAPEINELRYAERDARALHALFADTLGCGAELLVGAQATRAAIEAQFGALAHAEADDFVVIGFSGHGSETHELVTYDADVYDLERTCVPLDTLTEWFKAIPARRSSASSIVASRVRWVRRCSRSSRRHGRCCPKRRSSTSSLATAA